MAGLVRPSRSGERCSSRIGITGTRPVMTWEDVFLRGKKQGAPSSDDRWPVIGLHHPSFRLTQRTPPESPRFLPYGPTIHHEALPYTRTRCPQEMPKPDP